MNDDNTLELTELGEVESNCCGAKVYLGGICADCKEPCEIINLTKQDE